MSELFNYVMAHGKVTTFITSFVVFSIAVACVYLLIFSPFIMAGLVPMGYVTPAAVGCGVGIGFVNAVVVSLMAD